MPKSPQFVEITVDRHQLNIECQWVGSNNTNHPLIVFLHEGLGSLAMWKSFPEELCRRVGARGLVYSRPGYGQSTQRPSTQKWPVEFMHHQAYKVLPSLLASLDIDSTPLFLLGHSDGASIALLYGAQFSQDVDGIIVLAPHLFVETISIESIKKIRQIYLETNLREKLGRYHQSPDSAFWGWNDIWLDPAFRQWNIEAEIRGLAKPILAIQGVDDEYGTMKHIHRLQELASDCTVKAIAKCGHSPHIDWPDIVIEETEIFINRLA